MNQSKAFLISFIAAAVAMVLVFVYIDDVKDKIKATYGTEVVVVVAKQDINELEEIQTEMLETAVVPKNIAQPDSHGDIKTFEGSVAGAPIKAGEQVLLTKVLLKGAYTGISSQVAIHHRAISIPVNNVTGVTKLLKPGDRVDIISNVQYATPDGVKSEVKTLLQNVHVLAVGEQIQNNIPERFEKDPVSGNKRVVNLRGDTQFNTVTIEVTPLDAQKTIFIIESGAQLFLTLRNPVDRLVSSVPTTTVDEVLGDNSRKAALEAAKNRIPAAAPVPRPTVVKPKPSSAFGKGGIPIAN